MEIQWNKWNLFFYELTHRVVFGSFSVFSLSSTVSCILFELQQSTLWIRRWQLKWYQQCGALTTQFITNDTNEILRQETLPYWSSDCSTAERRIQLSCTGVEGCWSPASGNTRESHSLPAIVHIRKSFSGEVTCLPHALE